MNLRILFVEDSPDDVALMLGRLRKAGVEPAWQRVETAAALREALAGERWEFALVDFNLPSFSGPEAIALLAELAPDTPAITVSGAISEDTAVATITAGAVDYVLKSNLTRLAPAALRAVEGAALRRRQRRAAAQAQQTQFAIDHSSQAILYVSEGGVVLYVNAAAERLGGVAADEAVGQKIWAWIPAADERRWAALWRAAAQAPVVDFEATVRLPGGEERLISATLDHHERDEDSFVIVYARDITAQRAVERRAAESEARYRRIVEMASEGIWAVDERHATTFVNPRMAHMLGYEPEEMIGRVDSDFMFAEDLAAQQARRQARKKGLPGAYVRRFRSRDGVELWISVSSVAELGPEGEFLGSFALCTDITERKRAEDALRKSETHFRAFFEQASVGMTTTSPEKGWLEVNDALCGMLGYAREELERSTWADLTYADDLAADVAQFERLVSGEIDHYALDKRFVHKSGSLVYTHLAVRGVRKDDGGFAYIAAVLEDITERKLAEDALRESEERFEGFAAHFPGYLFMQDEERRYVYVNRREDTDGDVPREEWFGRTPSQVWEGEDALAEEVRVQRALDGELVDEVVPWMPPEVYQHMHSIYFPIPRVGKPPLIGGLSIDVTAQVEAEEEVRRQAEQLRRTVEGAVLAISLVVETRDPYTAGHERRVSELATAIAAEMGMEGEALTALRLGGLIHDVGKIAVPAEILSRPGRLSEVEFNLIKQHPQAGFDILAAIDFGLPVAEMVLQHHERLDGSGYPRGLAGEDVLPEARILAVADVVEAMSSHRPYRPALGMAAALAEVRAHAGVKYDAEVVAICARLVEERGFVFTG